MENQCLAIPSIPMQQWGQIYDPAQALAEGTIFPELNKPFYMAPEGCNTTLPRSGELAAFSQICFAATDAMLYLDTHPGDMQAREYYENCLIKKKELMERADCGCCSAAHYDWENKPIVWEGGNC